MVTSTRPPFVVFGAVKLAAFPCSLIDMESFVASGLLLPPHPAITAAAVIAGCGGSSNPEATKLSMSISEQGKAASFTAPKTTKGGLVEVTIANHGKAPHGVQFIQ